jgi:hypothetical protein
MAINRRALSAQADSGRRPGHQHWSASSATAYLRPALLYNTSLTLLTALMPSTTLAYPQVVSRLFAYFPVR